MTVRAYSVGCCLFLRNKVFSRPSVKEVVYQHHASFINAFGVLESREPEEPTGKNGRNKMKRLLLAFTAVLLFALALSSCKKDETNNVNNNGNTENPGGGSGGGNYNNQEYPSTANVIRRAVTDIDGNIYDAVQIGNQVWMAENLRTTKYADGSTIPLGTDSSTTTAYRYAPGSNQSNEENMVNVPRYGYLYNWPAVMHGASSSEANPSGVQGVCPNGWHVPSLPEWTELRNYMKTQPQYMASGNADHLAKALAATWGWYSSDRIHVTGNNPSTNNATGFSALSTGFYRFPRGITEFCITARFWSATEDFDFYADACELCYEEAYMHIFSKKEDLGHSVRCVRD